MIKTKQQNVYAVKPYTIAMVGENEAEINMYGEVVEEHPVDWWTGEPVPGNYIALDDFLRDLDELGGKDNITVHINSVGGSLYAGLAIYNRLKSLSAHVTTINDALAASAASIIFMAGDSRMVNAGSSIMIHEAAGFLLGYYQTKDLKDVIRQLDAHNKTAAAAYAQATGKDAETVKSMMAKETWMTGQEAVDAGFADEVIDSGIEPVMSLSPDKRFIVSNGVAMSMRGISSVPSGVQTMTAAQAAIFMPKNDGSKRVSPAPQDGIKNDQTGGKHMEIKNTDELRAACPDLVAQIENAAKDAARADGIKAERERIQGIEDIESAIGDKEMVKAAKYGDKPLTAEQLAFKAMQAQAAIGATIVKNLDTDAKSSGAAGVTASPVDTTGVSDDEKQESEAVNMIAGFRPKKKEV